MSPEQIVDLMARMTPPDESSDPHDSEQALARLILESRGAMSPGRRRGRAWVYSHQGPGFTQAMLRIQAAPIDELRKFAMDVVDLLWGVGSATSRRTSRSLDFDKEWDVGTIDDVAFLLSRSSLYPFKKVSGGSRNAPNPSR